MSLNNFKKLALFLLCTYWKSFISNVGNACENIKTLILAMSTISLTGVVMPAHAATDAEVDALRKEVSELKQLVQQLSNQQKR